VARVLAVCSFDIDETLKTSSLNNAAPFKDNARRAVERCNEMDFGIAINTAEYWCFDDEENTQSAQLKGLSHKLGYLGDIGFDGYVLNSRAIQFSSFAKICDADCHPSKKRDHQCVGAVKRRGVENIRDFYEVKPECVLSFDDKGYVKDALADGGFHNFVHVTADFSGIGETLLQQGLDMLAASNCTN